jgi:hypothetical protein
MQRKPLTYNYILYFFCFLLVFQGTELEDQAQDVALQCNVTAAECSLTFALAGYADRPIACQAAGCEFSDSEWVEGPAGHLSCCQ